MTTYRLLNNIFEYSSAYVDFRALRKQCGKLSVEFSQMNESLFNKLQSDWKPVGLKFESEKKKILTPDISIWNSSCLVVNKKGKEALNSFFEKSGELLTLENNYYLFNCLESLGGDTIDTAKTTFDIEFEDSVHIPKELEFLADKIVSKSIFKPGFAFNQFLVCQDDFKDTIENAGLAGLLFETNLAQIFPRKTGK